MDKISDAAKQQFDQEGYCLVPDFFDATDVQLMRQELQQLRDAGQLMNKCTDTDGKTYTDAYVNLQICPLSPHSALFRSLPYYGPVGDAIARLITPPFVLQLDQIFVKPASCGYGTNWHQDNAYFAAAQQEPHKGVGMWIAIDDTNVANGTMRLIPGSHKGMRQHRRDLQSDHFITCADSVDESLAVPVEVQAGGVAFFNFGVVHCTKDNRSAHDRAGLALHFAETDIISYDHAQDWPHIRGPEATNGLREYGVDLGAFWKTRRDEILQLS